MIIGQSVTARVSDTMDRLDVLVKQHMKRKERREQRGTIHFNIATADLFAFEINFLIAVSIA